jgi:two-component system phosphate regulon sensor histidine kinase PhoR
MLLVSIIIFIGVLYKYISGKVFDELESQAVYISQGVSQIGADYFNGLSTTNRITWIAADGTVLYDSLTDASSMKNHSDREEFKEALLNGKGEATRYSSTAMNKTLYFAALMSDGTVIRVSSTQDSVVTLLFELLYPTLWIIILAIILSVVLASKLSKRIIKPINEIDLEHPESCEAYDEISPLLSKINRQNRTIQKQIEQLRQKQQDFNIITENMSEGFLLIDKNTDIISYNSSALKLLGANQAGDRQSVLTLNRSESFRRTVDLALTGEHNEHLMQIEEQCYQLIANPVFHENTVAGAVIMILDVTEKEQRESLRREFTANVSHELKTPLTSISGFAEIMMRGLVKVEDVPGFAEDIYNEAQRLISLVGDIIELSQRDEGSHDLEKESVDLYSLAKDVVEHLKNSADKRGISIELKGEHAHISGVSRILEEMIYNLCDNAIKYNKENGNVTVTVGPCDKGTSLSVSDTGIGIPYAHQNRVFERFYRVDKSHSKEIGGTGLGLSIVKHGAAYHNATVEMESEVGKGTTVRIIF